MTSRPTEWRVPSARAYLALATAGFQRYATYRQAMVAAVVTNTVFGFLRFAVMLAVIDAGARIVAGYDEPQLATFVWAGQGLIGVVLLWAPPDFAERIRTGDVVTDLLRPIDPVWQMLAADLGRAGYAVLTRFVVPVVVGALAFNLYAPRRPVTYALFACSTLLATIVCFGCRYLTNATAYWLLDVRGPNTAWTLTSGMFGGLYFPVWFFPDAMAIGLIVATPFPSVIERLCRRLVVIDQGRIVQDGSLDDLHARYGSRRRLVVDLDEPLAAELALPGVTVESTQANGRRITYALDGTTTAGDLVNRLAEVAALRDISVLEPAIEDVVARLYTRQGTP